MQTEANANHYNAKEYNSAVYVQRIFSFEHEAPIESWLINSVEDLKGSTIQLATILMDVSHLINAEKWSLLYSLSMERVEKERIHISIAAFKFWEQQDFKELLNKVMDKSSFSSSARRKKKCKVLAIYYWACSKL